MNITGFIELQCFRHPSALKIVIPSLQESTSIQYPMFHPPTIVYFAIYLIFRYLSSAYCYHFQGLISFLLRSLLGSYASTIIFSFKRSSQNIKLISINNSVIKFCSSIVLFIFLFLLFFKINLYQMSNLEQDLLQFKEKIIGLVTEYEKVREETSKSNHNNQMHLLLESIASFEQQKVKELQNTIKNQTLQGYIKIIVEKLDKRPQRQKEKQNNHQKVEEAPKKEQPTKDAKLNQTKKNNQAKKGGLFSFITTKFSKQKKASQMILPDQQPKCYYDHATKSWVFQGQEPEAPKIIPKPPSQSQKKEKEQTKKQVQNDSSQLNQLTAPPVFKRKSTVKGKAKIKQQIQIVKLIQEPLSFAKMMEEITSNFERLLQKNRQGSYENHVVIQSNKQEILSELLSFTQKTISHGEQIHNCQNKVMQKWSKILTSQSRQQKIMQKIIKEMSESANTYQHVLQKIDQLQYSKRQTVRQVIRQVIVQKIIVQQSTNKIQQSKYYQLQRQREILSNEKLLLQIKVDGLIAQIHSLQEQAGLYKRLNQQYQTSNQIINQQLQRQRQQNKCLLTEIQNNKAQILQLYTQIKQKQLQQSNKILTLESQKVKLSIEKQSLSLKVKNLQNNIAKLQEQKTILSTSLYQQQFKTMKSINKINSQLGAQKIKIQTRLQSYQQKYNQYLKTFNTIHESISQGEPLQPSQNQLFLSIIQKRSLTINSPLQDSSINNNTNRFSLLQVSDIIASVTQSFLDHLHTISMNCSKLHKKYLQGKDLTNKIKNNAASESMILNRSVAKLKALLQIERSARKQTQQRCSRLQLQCDKLAKKLQHYREEDQFNKSYLSKLKTSNISTQNQNILSLQQDKDELTTQVGDLQKEIQQKSQALKKTQNDLEDLLANYEKSQSQLLQIQRKYKQNDKQIKNHKRSREQLEKKVKLLELKLQNQKERYDQIQNREETRLKNAQGSFQKKLKILRNQLQQSNDRQAQLKQQIQQLKNQQKIRLHSAQQNHRNIQSQLKRALKQKQNENNALVLLLNQSHHKYDQQKQQRNDLIEKNYELTRRQMQLKDKLNEANSQHIKEVSLLREQQHNMNNAIASLIQKYASFKNDQEQLKNQYDQRLFKLQQELLASHLQANQLLAQIHQYSTHILSLNNHIEQMKIQQQNIRKQNENQLTFAIRENTQLKLALAKVNQQLASLTQKNQQYQEIIQKTSQDISRLISNTEQLSKEKVDLEQKLIMKDRQIQTLSNQISDQQEKLMIKTEELLEKDRVLLERQELSVTIKQQFDQLKNQFHTMKKQIYDKKQQIQQLTLKIQQKQQQTNKLQKDLGVLQQKMKDQRNQYECKQQQSSRQISKLTVQNNRLRSILDHTQLQMKHIVIQNRQYQQRICIKQCSLLQRQDWIWDLIRKCQQTERELNTYQQKTHENKEENTSILKEKVQLLTKLQELNCSIKQKEQQMGVLKNNINKLNIDNNLLIEEKQQLQNNVSELMMTIKLLRIDKQNLISKLQVSQRQLSQKQVKNAMDLHNASQPIQNQEKQKLISALEKQKDILRQRLTVLQKQLGSLTQIMQSQEKIISESKGIQIQEMKDKQSNSLDPIIREQTIEKLNKQILDLTSLNKELSQNYKSLQDQNTSLLKQKVQLMKSNDYLVTINQKLVAGNKVAGKQLHKAQSQILSSSNEESKKQSKGLFGTISSLFLTPSQAQRLRK